MVHNWWVVYTRIFATPSRIGRLFIAFINYIGKLATVPQFELGLLLVTPFFAALTYLFINYNPTLVVSGHINDHKTYWGQFPHHRLVILIHWGVCPENGHRMAIKILHTVSKCEKLMSAVKYEWRTIMVVVSDAFRCSIWGLCLFGLKKEEYPWLLCEIKIIDLPLLPHKGHN